jgi:hypothetical protein
VEGPKQTVRKLRRHFKKMTSEKRQASFR